MIRYEPPRLDDPEALAAGTLVHALEQRACAEETTPFVSFDERPPLTAAELHSLVRRFSAALEVARGSRVLVCLDNSPEFVIAWLGSGHAGATMVPVVPRAGLRAYARAIELTEPSLAIVNAESRAKVAETPFAGRVVEVDDTADGLLCPVFERRLLAT